MRIKIYEDRFLVSEEITGSQYENLATTLEFEFPETINNIPISEFNKYIVFDIEQSDNQDIIKGNNYSIPYDITKLGEVTFYVKLEEKSEDENVTNKLIWISRGLPISFNKTKEGTTIITTEKLDAFNTAVTILNETTNEAEKLINDIETKLENIENDFNIQNGESVNSLQQKFESTSWNTSNDVVKEYIENDTANGDGNKISYEEIEGKYSINVVTNGKSAFNQNGKGQTVGGKSHVEGSKNIAFESNAHAEGNETFAGGKHSHAEGNTTSATGNASHSEGFNTKATGIASHTEGSETKAFGDFAHSEGALTQANNSSSHAEGLETISSGLASHTEGGHTEATQNCAHAEGYYTHAIGQYTHAEGCETIAEGGNAHAEGRNTHAEGWESHAEGGSTHAQGGTSHAEGDTTVAIGGGSHAEGYHTVAVANHSHAEGRYNTIDENGDYVHMVGNGYYDEVNEKEVRSNAYTLDWNGNGVYTGGVKVYGEKDVATTEYVDKGINEIEEIAERAETIAKGRATGYVFDTLQDLELWLQDVENTSKLVLGDNFYIRALNTPDYWWDGEQKQQLETQKVDLSEYVKNTDFATSSKAGLLRPANGLFTSGSTGALLIAKATNAQIDAKTDNYYPIVPSNLVYAVKSALNSGILAYDETTETLTITTE